MSAPCVSELSALATQPVREITALLPSSRLNSEIAAHGCPPISDSASSFTYCAVIVPPPPLPVTVQVNDLLAVPPLPSLTVTVGVKVPADVGLPVIVPVLVLIARPAGSPVAENESVSPSGSLALIGSDTACPTVEAWLATAASVGGWLVVTVPSVTVFSVESAAKLPCATCVQFVPSLLV